MHLFLALSLTLSIGACKKKMTEGPAVDLEAQRLARRPPPVALGRCTPKVYVNNVITVQECDHAGFRWHCQQHPNPDAAIACSISAELAAEQTPDAK